jgi:peptidyl-prolyl cis-trans isomerase A (cyclophilin A)
MQRLGPGAAIFVIVALGAFPIAHTRAQRGAAAPPPLPHVLIETDAGEIEAEIDVVHAPISGENFLKYVDGGYFDGGRFFRAVRADNQPADKVKIAVIQGEGNRATVREKGGFPPIVLERTNLTGLKHVDGTLSMARSGPDTATHSFSIVVGDQPGLDYGSERNPDLQGFAAFGRVVRGMDVVRKINAMPAGGTTGQTLTTPVAIVRVSRVPTAGR